MSVLLGNGEHQYRVVEDWAQLPENWTFMDVAAVGCAQSARPNHSGSHVRI